MSEAACYLLSVCGRYDSCLLDVVVAACPHANHKPVGGAHQFQLSQASSPDACKSAMLGSPWHTPEWQASILFAGTH